MPVAILVLPAVAVVLLHRDGKLVDFTKSLWWFICDPDRFFRKNSFKKRFSQILHKMPKYNPLKNNVIGEDFAEI